MPNAWETARYLNYNDPADASVDFDRDGLTSLQEYTLSLQGRGEGPVGVWTTELIDLAGVVSPQSSNHRKELVGLNDNDDALFTVTSGPYPPSPGSDRYSVWVRRASDGSWRSLSTVNGNVATYIRAYGINDQGEVVGVAKAAGVNGGNEFAFKKNIFAGTPSTDVSPWYLPGQPSAPARSITAINNHGDLIGKDANGASFFYKQTSGTAVSSPAGWTGVNYLALNNMGQASGTEQSDPWGAEAYSHFLISPGWNWHAQYPGYTNGAIDTNGIEVPWYTPVGTFRPTVLNDWGEFAGAYAWRISVFEGPDEEDPTWNTGSWFFDGTSYRELLPSGTYAGQIIYDTNNWPQTLVSGYTDEWGEDVVSFVHVDGVNVPMSAISPGTPIGNNTYGYAIPRQINNRSTIAGIIENQDKLYLLRSAQDGDKDRLPNDWEIYHGLDPYDVSDATLDADSDGYSNLAEYHLGGDPTNASNHSSTVNPVARDAIDMDGDGIPDAWERENFPSLSYPWCQPGDDADNDLLDNEMEWVFDANPNSTDTDSDGLADTTEVLLAGTDPRNTDSDGDGVPDLVEYTDGTDPMNPQSKPERRMEFFYWGSWHTELNFGFRYSTIDQAGLKVRWSYPMDEEFVMEVEKVKMVLDEEASEGSPDAIYKIGSSETASFTIPKGATESNSISTADLNDDEYIYLMPTKENFFRPQEVQNAVPWKLSREQRQISKTEALTKGVKVRINNDDDNNNAVSDSTETAGSAAENDLVELYMGYTELDTGLEMVIKKPAGVRVWADKERTTAIAGTGSQVVWQITNHPGSLWVECTSPVASGNLELLVREEAGGVEIPLSNTPIRTFEKVAIGVSGEVQSFTWNPNDVARWDREAAGQGLFEVCQNLYLKGHNVHYYAEPHIIASGPAAGDGPVYNELYFQTLLCSVDEAVLFGYSHGASGCYQLLGRMSGSPASSAFTVPLTCYVDAITRGGTSSEQRYPALTASHWNTFQRNDFFLKGNTVAGAFPGAGGSNVSHLGVVHAGGNGIHHHPTVKSALETIVESKL